MSKAKSDNELLEEIGGKLDLVIALLAIQGKEQGAQIKILYSLGFDSNTIGRLVGMSGTAVRVRKFRGRK
ncbi:MAG: hypothetical protein ABSH21_02660 [Verrucomicrobiia bacterium]|jgi:hypothetical protein